MMPIENIQEFRSVGSAVGASKRFFFCAQFACRLQVAKVAGPGAFKRSGHFL